MENGLLNFTRVYNIKPRRSTEDQFTRPRLKCSIFIELPVLKVICFIIINDGNTKAVFALLWNNITQSIGRRQPQCLTIVLQNIQYSIIWQTIRRGEYLELSCFRAVNIQAFTRTDPNFPLAVLRNADNAVVT